MDLRYGSHLNWVLNDHHYMIQRVTWGNIPTSAVDWGLHWHQQSSNNQVQAYLEGSRKYTMSHEINNCLIIIVAHSDSIKDQINKHFQATNAFSKRWKPTWDQCTCFYSVEINKEKLTKWRYTCQDCDAAHADEQYLYLDNASAPLVFFWTSTQQTTSRLKKTQFIRR